jgi:hypothetical protein
MDKAVVGALAALFGLVAFLIAATIGHAALEAIRAFIIALVANTGG